MKENEIKNKIKEVINTVNELLLNNNEWINRYQSYSDGIDKQMDVNIKSRKLFKVNSPLYAYSSISKTIKTRCEYDLRYKGQSIGGIKIDKNDKVLFSTNDENNNKHFGIDSSLSCNNESWNSPKAKEVRKRFRDLPHDTKTKSPEHSLENKLLAEFSKRKSCNKPLLNIQPIKIHGQFFQMPTPLKASTSEVEYAKSSGGGIDIMARIKVKGEVVSKNNRLVIFELKDENKSSEPVDKVILQAVAYATFIANLLIEQPQWSDIFGFKSVPNEIYVATLMPENAKSESASFEGLEFMIKDKIKLKLETLYFDEDLKFSGARKA